MHASASLCCGRCQFSSYSLWHVAQGVDWVGVASHILATPARPAPSRGLGAKHKNKVHVVCDPKLLVLLLLLTTGAHGGHCGATNRVKLGSSEGILGLRLIYVPWLLAQ